MWAILIEVVPLCKLLSNTLEAGVEKICHNLRDETLLEEMIHSTSNVNFTLHFKIEPLFTTQCIIDLNILYILVIIFRFLYSALTRSSTYFMIYVSQLC